MEWYKKKDTYNIVTSRDTPSNISHTQHTPITPSISYTDDVTHLQQIRTLSSLASSLLVSEKHLAQKETSLPSSVYEWEKVIVNMKAWNKIKAI